MSTGCECCVIERTPGKWFYILEDYHAPKNSFDWMEYATAAGPFPSEDKAMEHLHNHHANPGGYWTDEYREDRKESETMKRLLDAAEKSKSNRNLRGWLLGGRY